MPIGTSLGAFFDDGFHQAAAQWNPDKYDADNKMVQTPNQADQNKQMDKIEETELGGTPVAYKTASPLVTITDQDIDTGMSLGMAFSGGGLKTKGFSIDPPGVTRLKPPTANDNVEGLYNPREPSMIGSKALDDSLDASWNQAVDKHQTFIKKYDELNKFGQDVLSKSKGDNYDFNLAKYNKMGRDLNSEWVDVPNDPLGLKPEKVTRAALKYKDTLYEGENHGFALSKIMDKEPDVSMKDIEDGFSTSHGRFVSREEAFGIAKSQNQIEQKVLESIPKGQEYNMLLSEDINPIQ